MRRASRRMGGELSRCMSGAAANLAVAVETQGNDTILGSREYQCVAAATCKYRSAGVARDNFGPSAARADSRCCHSAAYCANQWSVSRNKPASLIRNGCGAHSIGHSDDRRRVSNSRVVCVTPGSRDDNRHQGKCWPVSRLLQRTSLELDAERACI